MQKQVKEIKVLYHNNGEELTFVGGIEKSCAVDLYTAEDIEIGMEEFALISLGVSIDLPKGYKADIRPRSSMFKNYGILQTNSVGLVDSSYVGKGDIWSLPVYRPMTIEGHRELLFQSLKNISVIDTTDVKHERIDVKSLIPERIGVISIPKGTRLCQVEIYPVQDEIKFVATKLEDWNNEEDRNGFGIGTGK